MDVERRVAKLEEEMHILKNEIQSVLLDIESQLLSHYYPSLRSSDVDESAAKGRARPRNVEREEPEARPPNELTQVAIKRVSLDELRETEPEPAAKSAARPAPSRTGMTNTAALLGWVKQTVESIGPEAASETITSLTQDGYLDADTAASLLQIVSLAPKPEHGQPADMSAVVSAIAAFGRVVGSHSEPTR